MSKSSKARKARARAKKFAAKNRNAVDSYDTAEARLDPANFSKEDKRYLIAFTILSFIITLFYWNMGGRNLFVFPALLCISVGARKYWSGPIRRFADDT